MLKFLRMTNSKCSCRYMYFPDIYSRPKSMNYRTLYLILFQTILFHCFHCLSIIQSTCFCFNNIHYVANKLAVLNFAFKSFKLVLTAFKSVTRVFTSPLISDSAVLKLLTSVLTSAFISFANVMTVGKSVESAESTLTAD